jgi:hypothetical protein
MCTRFGYIRKHDFNSVEHLKYARFGLEEHNETQRLGQWPHLCSGGATWQHHHKNRAAPSYVQWWCALDDSAAYNPRASREETWKEGEETSGLLSPHDQARLGRRSTAVKDKTEMVILVITRHSSQHWDDGVPEISKTPKFMRERWGQELKIWAATRTGKIWAHLRCFHGRQLLILLASRKGTTRGWQLLGLPREQRGARRGEAPLLYQGKEG